MAAVMGGRLGVWRREYPFGHGDLLRQQTSQLHKVALKPNLKRFIPMGWNGNSDRTTRFGVDYDGCR
jgi:hypothetical protein